jgi:flagellin-specific chaperone FliS
MEAGRPLVGAQALLKCVRIVNALMSVLKPSAAPELCQHLGTVYGFVCLRLNMAVSKKDVALAREAERVFQPVASAFIEISQRAEARL